MKVALLQEQCNIQIPNAYGEMAMRIDGLSEHLKSSNAIIDKVWKLRSYLMLCAGYS